MSFKGSKSFRPFKIFCMVLKGDYPYVRFPEPGLVEIDSGPFARRVYVTADNLRDHLRTLAKWRYITALEFSQGKATFRLVPFKDGRLP